MRWRAGVLAGGLLAGLMIWSGPSRAQSGDISGPTDIAGLEAAFGVAEIRSDYVVVIDTSASMEQGPEPLFPKVREAYSALVDAIPDGDRLTLITFDGTTEKRPNIEVNPTTREAARPLPPADGQNTDIGAALHSAVEALDQPDAAAIQTVIFITDGNPQPRPGSPFDPVGSPAWRAARARAADLEARRTINVRALGLTDAGKQGADLAAEVFGTPEVVRVSSDQLRDYLTTEVRNARRRVLEKAVQDEIDDGLIDVEVRSEGRLGDQVKAEVELTSRVERLAVAVDLEAVSAKDFEGRAVRSSIVGGSRTLHIPPGGSSTFEVLIKPSVGEPPLFSLPPPGREEVDITLDFTQSATATPPRLLQDELGLDTAIDVGVVDPFTVGRDTGKTWGRFALELVAALVVALVTFRLWWRYIRKPRLAGTLVLVGASDGGPEVRLTGKKMIVEASDFGRVGATRIKVFTRRGKGGRVYADRIGVDGAFDRQQRSRWKPVEAGSQLGVASYRLDGDGGTRFRWRSGEDES